MMKYVPILLLICFSIFALPLNVIAENRSDSNQQAFLAFEKKVYDLIDSAVEPLNKLDDENLDMKNFHIIIFSSKSKFAGASLAFAKIVVPSALPNDIKTSLRQVKNDLHTGFESLGESLNAYLQYMVDGNISPHLFDRFIEKRDKGISYIDGGLVLLATVKLQLHSLEYEIKPNPWAATKRHFYDLQSIVASGEI